MSTDAQDLDGTGTEDKEALKAEVIAAKRGPFIGWWAALLDAEPRMLRKIHNMLRDVESSEQVSECMRHLVWGVADAVVTHLYPRGLGVHMKIAMECGATKAQIVEALQIATAASCTGFARGLPTILSVIAEHDRSFAGGAELSPDQLAVKHELSAKAGFWEDWMEDALRFSPGTLRALIELGQPISGETGLSRKDRHLLFLAAYACPAIADRAQTRLHARLALEAGATGEELLGVLRTCNTIGVHAMAEGMTAMGADW